MATASATSSVSCFAKLKGCLCSEPTKNLALYSAWSIAGLASFLLIPIDPLKGAGVGISFYPILYKACSVGQEGREFPPPPRSWKQIVLGAAVSTGVMALAFTIHGMWAPVVAATGLILGSTITFGCDPVWQLCDILWSRCCGSCGILPSSNGKGHLENG